MTKVDEPRPTTAPRWMSAELPAAIFVITFACFTPALFADFVIYDDEVNFLQNPHYRGLSWEHLKWMWTDCRGLYMPVTWMTLGLDYLLWGVKPHGYHFANVALHAANAALFYAVLLALLGTQTPRGAWAAAAGALFFSIHPLRAESVAWVTERRDVVSGFFFLLTMLAYIHMARADTHAARWRWYAASLACFALSLLSKAAAMALPAALIVLDVWPLGRFVPGRRARILAEKIPFFAVALAIAWLAIIAQQRAGALLPLERQGPLDRGLQAAYGLCFYVWKTLLPIGLSPIYVRKGALEIADPRFVGALLVVIAVTAALVMLRRRRPELLTAWLFYGIVVSPVVGFVQVGPHVAADRYTYLPCLAWAALATGALVKWPSRRTFAGGAIVLAGLGVLAAFQTTIWMDSYSLLGHAIRLDPENFYARYGRGLLYLRAKDPKAAIADLDEAVRFNRSWSEPLRLRGRARGMIGDFPGAIADFDAAVALLSPQPPAEQQRAFLHEIYWHRAAARARLDDVPGAIDDWTRALQTAPADWEHRAGVRQDIEEARRRLRKH